MDLHYEFRDPDLFELALTHASRQAERDNERLEFLGDAALDLIVAEELYHHHGTLPEGRDGAQGRRRLSPHARAGFAAARARRARARRRRRCGDARCRRRCSPTCTKALLGAIYLDGGFEAVREFVRKTLAGPLERARELRSVENPKQRCST
jgi:ribonuclease-3